MWLVLGSGLPPALPVYSIHPTVPPPPRPSRMGSFPSSLAPCSVYPNAVYPKHTCLVYGRVFYVLLQLRSFKGLLCYMGALEEHYGLQLAKSHNVHPFLLLFSK